MPCGHHHFGHHYGYGPPPGYPCPYCGYYHPSAYGPSWQPGWAGGGFGYGPPPGWRPPGPPSGPPGPWATPGYGPPSAPPMSDEDIRAAVGNYLRADPRIPPQAQIQVDVQKGVVTLTGSVPDKWIKHTAGEAALGVPGVVDVQNNLQVARPGQEGP